MATQLPDANERQRAEIVHNRPQFSLAGNRSAVTKLK